MGSSIVISAAQFSARRVVELQWRDVPRGGERDTLEFGSESRALAFDVVVPSCRGVLHHLIPRGRATHTTTHPQGYRRHRGLRNRFATEVVAVRSPNEGTTAETSVSTSSLFHPHCLKGRLTVLSSSASSFHSSLGLYYLMLCTDGIAFLVTGSWSAEYFNKGWIPDVLSCSLKFHSRNSANAYRVHMLANNVL
jgi:hypothetical protein